MTFEESRKILFLYSKSYCNIRAVSENRILTFKILFSHSNRVGKCYFNIQNPIVTFELSQKIVFCIQNPILTFELNRKILYWNWKSYFQIRTESENAILTFKILFWHSNRVGKCYFDIQNPILTFELSRKIVFGHSKSYCDVRTESENRILTFKILFWHSNWVGKCYFNIQNPISTFELSRQIVIGHSKSYCDVRTKSENRILTFKILFWHSNWVGKSVFWHS